MFNEVLKKISDKRKILILTHINPDGDALGSASAFKLILEKAGKEAVVLLSSPLPESLKIFGDYFSFGDTDFSYDLAVSVDTGDIDRLGDLKKYFKGETLNIDHHKSNTNFADVNFVDPSASATGEIIARLSKAMNIVPDAEIASALYGAILTDTGGFMFSNTTEETHKIAGKLISLGASFYNLNKKLMLEKDYKRQYLTAKCIENMEFFENGKISVITITNEYAKHNDIKEEDLNGLAQLPRTVSGVEVGVLISEVNKGTVKVSLRSDEIVDVSEIAEKFGGGGHIRASGIRIADGDIEKVKKNILKEISDKL